MKRIGRLLALGTRLWTLVAALIFAAGTSAYALHMAKMPKQLQTTIAEPRMRTLSLKLPLRQPMFHWTFMSRKQFLAGRLVLRITRNGQTAEITICENGQFLEGWEPLSLPRDPKTGEPCNPKAGELYFGFQSTTKYATAPDDQLEIELHVVKDLDGIGADQTGILPAGTYKAKGTYSGLIDEYKVPASLPKELADKMRKMYSSRHSLRTGRSNGTYASRVMRDGCRRKSDNSTTR